MQIVKFKKVGKSRYKLCFENTELILHEELIIKYNLLSKRNIDSKQMELLLKENLFYDAYDVALRLLSVKLRTKKEMQALLEKKNYDSKIIEKVIDKIVDEGYINDNKYIELYINDRINLTTDGPYKIKNYLLKNDLDIDYIDNYLSKIDDSVWKDRVKHIIDKKIKVNRNSNYIFKNKITSYLNNMGYDKVLVNEILSKYSFNDKDNLQKEYDKIKRKYSKKYSGEKLELMIKKYLYSKGYKYERISDIYED